MIATERKAGSCMYVLLSQDHRVSRSFRATWYLRMLLTGQDIPSSDDMTVLSGLREESLSSSTDVFYICQQYSLVFALDMTATMMQVSNCTRQVKLNEAVSALSASLNQLSKPFKVPGSEELLQPDLCVTVLAFCGNRSRKPIQVLLQGICLRRSNCEEITKRLSNDITALENTLARDSSKFTRSHEEYFREQQPGGSGDASMEGLIKAGTLALQLLPRNALKGVVILTDGVLGFSSPSSMHNAVNQMRGANTSCWVVQVGGSSEPGAAFGLMPDSETLNFMSLACNGCVIHPDKISEAAATDLVAPNPLQRAVLFWSFQQAAHASRVEGVVGEGWGEGRGEEEEENFSPTIYRQFDKNTIHAPLLCVIGCRVREGFFLKSVSVKNEESVLEVIMYYPWQASVNIYYNIEAPWPLSETITTLSTITAYDGPYSFVNDVHYSLNQPIISHFRVTAVRKFKQALKSLSHSDTFLAHFLSFSATPTYHTLPQKIQDGMPLFHLHQNQAKPVPAVGLSSSGDKKKKESALVNYWMHLCTIDTSLWYRWFHTDKIIIILEQDTYLPRNLLSPSANGRFASVQCRIAATKLFDYLKTWCSFVLLESQSFIRFLPSTESPKYFSLVRVAQKHPCVVLHVGHIEGTPHSLQTETLRELQLSLEELCVERVLPKRRGSVKGKAAKPCAFLIGKQLQRVMIRYDNPAVAGTPVQTTLSLLQTAVETERLVQNDYLTNSCWKWVVPHPLPSLLTALLRHRLKEGFHITRAQSGVVTLTAQLSVTQPASPHDLPMLLQYVIFPFSAHHPTSSEASYPTCELWVEPQYGTVTQAPPGLQYILGCTHTQIAQKIHTRDREVLSAISSFIYLHHMCQKGCHTLPRSPIEDTDGGTGSSVCLSSSRPRSTIVPFQFAQLLPKCRVVAFLLDAFPEVTTERTLNSFQRSPLNSLFWKQLSEKLKELAPTEVPLTSPPLAPLPTHSPTSPLPPHSPSSPALSPLLQRLLSSDQLTELCRLCDIREDTRGLGWKCFSTSPDEDENTVCMLLVPNVFCKGVESDGSGDVRLSRETASAENGGEREEEAAAEAQEEIISTVFALPVILLHCHQDLLLDPDPAMPSPPSLQPDLFQHLTLGLSHSPSPVSAALPSTHFTPSPQASLNSTEPPNPLKDLYSSLANESLCNLVSKLRAVHFSSYLHALHMTLRHKYPVPSEAFLAAINICTRSTLSLDCTSLIGTLCRHSRVEQQLPSSSGAAAEESGGSKTFPFGPEMLAQLLKTTSSSNSAQYRLSYVDLPDTTMASPPPHCVQWEGEPQRLFETYLSEAGFEGVPHCEGYYWLRGEDQLNETPKGRREHGTLTAEMAFGEEIPKQFETNFDGEDDAEGDGGQRGREAGEVEDLERKVHLSPPSEPSTIQKPSSVGDSEHTELSDHDSTSTGDDIDMALSPLFSPSDTHHFLESSRSDPSLPTAPLFLHVACSVQASGCDGGEKEGESLPEQPPQIPVCLKSILASDNSPTPPASSASYSVSLSLSFFSFSPDTVTRAPTRTTTEESVTISESSLSSLPVEYHSTASTIKQKVEWLITDELISIAREATPITPPLLQAVATHVQTSHASSCSDQRVPLKFVFGPKKSMIHLITQMESIDIAGYDVKKCDEYYYLAHRKQTLQSILHTPDLDNFPPGKTSIFGSLSAPFVRSKTPDSEPPQGRWRGHQRSTSATVFPLSHTSQGNMRWRRRGSTPSRDPLSGYPSSTSLVPAGSGYEASRSSSCSEISAIPPHSPLDEEQNRGDSPPFWLAVRVLQQEVQIYFQIRHSSPELENHLTRLHPLITELCKKVKEACHRANQWLLLHDMLETRQCSHLLLPEGLSEAWVEEVVHKRMPMVEGGSGMDMFGPQEFQCDLMWNKHITPHYRLKSMKMNIRKALQITRVALDAFAVTNRKDVYILQDVQENGDESIFYLKIDESLCRVDDGTDTEEPTITYERCDTRASETMSNISISYQPSISEHVAPEPERRGSGEGPFDQLGKPQESLVLQLYGISKPSESLLERLTHRIIFKLDDAALEIMCGLYARNHKLKLTPSDVHFLQPAVSEPSHCLHIVVPQWVAEIQALFFYFLQSLSTLALKPKYTSAEPHTHFQVPQSQQNAYLVAGLPTDLHQDHVFLYIRPHTQGRGMAVFSVSLTTSEGELVPPGQCEVAPREGGWDPAILQRSHSVCAQGTEAVLEGVEEIPESDGHLLRVDIWEKGNVGMTDLSVKLHLSLKQALCDYILELYFLPQPIARVDYISSLASSPIHGTASPFTVLEPSPTELHRQPSLEENRDSPRRALFERGEVRVPSSLGFMTQRGMDIPLSPDTPVVSEPRRSHSDTYTITQEMNKVLRSIETNSLQREAAEEEQTEAAGLTWQEKEKIRRETEALEAYRKEAYHGRRGVLDDTYSSLIQEHLAETYKLSSHSVSRYTFPLLGSYSAEVFLNEAISIFCQVCPDLSLSAFKLDCGEYSYYSPQKTSRQRATNDISEIKFIVVGRNLRQWDEARSPGVLEIRLTQPWIDPQTKQSLQLFQPLDSKKISKMVEYPLMPLAKEQPCYIPRQRLVLLSISREEAELWLYNLSDELAVQVRNRFNGLNKWQQTRVGLLHHLLAQKMGLFQHTHARDLQEWTSMAAKHCSSLQETMTLYRNPTPVPSSSSQRQQRPQPMPALETLYLEAVPAGHTLHTMDPVYNHGHQVRESHAHFRKSYESRDLLGKVFTSWQNRTGSAMAPVSSSLIHQLKKLARLLHFCSSPLLLCPPSPSPSLLTDSGPTEQALWFDAIRNEVLSLYIQYLKTLSFEEVTERATTTAPPRHREKGLGHTPTRASQTSLTSTATPTPPQKPYKCMQRSWTHGIILIELTFWEERFDVKLFTLESSRLNGQKSLSPEVYGLFSTECARYKDFIHLHSFMHDFHLSMVLGMLQREREIPDWLNLKKFLGRFIQENKLLPTFIRNRLERGHIVVPLSTVKPAQLYHHILSHSDVFGMQTMELRSPGSQSGSSETTASDICLHINVCPQSLGPTTSPQLSKLLQDAQENYSIHIVAMCEVDNAHRLELIFYLLLVNKYDKFPRLTCDSPHLNRSGLQHAIPSTKPTLSPEDPTLSPGPESELHLSVRKRRLKLGLDPFLRPSTASQLVLDGSLIRERIQGLQVHFESIVKNAEHHMRRDELWKRMLYGRYRAEPRPVVLQQASFEQLSLVEFRELLRLVNTCPLEKLDPRLTALRRQTKKWFRRLMATMEVRFSENARVYKSENENYYFTAVVNPDWADMVILAQSNRDEKTQGLHAVYRKPQEGGAVPLEQRPITAHVEADQQHIESIVNFCCSFLWASMLDSTPPQPHLTLL